MAAGQFSKDPVVDRALRHSVRDGMAFSVQVGAGETYFSAFALFLRATAPQVALLTTLPPLLGSLAQIFSAWLGGYVGRKRVVLAGCVLQAFLWLPILLVPVLFGGHAVDGAADPALALLQREQPRDAAVDEHHARSRLGTAARPLLRLSNAAHDDHARSSRSWSAGVLLHELDTSGATYLGFVLIFLVAFVARLVSGVSPHVPVTSPRCTTRCPTCTSSTGGAACCRPARSGSRRYFALMNAAVGISAPFFTVYMLRDLRLSYLEFTALSGMSVIVQYLMLSTWGRIADVYGNRLVLIVTSISLPIVPLLWLLSDDFWWLLVCQAASGLSWSGFTLSCGNLLYELVPRTRRAAYVAFHNVGTAAGVFAGAMLGAALARRAAAAHGAVRRRSLRRATCSTCSRCRDSRARSSRRCSRAGSAISASRAARSRRRRS